MSTFKIKDPDEVEMTLTVTMKLKDWRLIKGCVAGKNYDENWPAWSLHGDIDALISSAEETFYQ